MDFLFQVFNLTFQTLGFLLPHLTISMQLIQLVVLLERLLVDKGLISFILLL